MPSPYAHALAGIALALPLMRTKTQARHHKEDIATLVGFSILPDADFLLRLFAEKNIATYFNNMTHSIVFAGTVCLLYSLVRTRIRPYRSLARTFALCSAAYGLHLCMDFFNYGRVYLPFWPFSEQHVSPPVPLFYGFRSGQGFFSHHHLITFATESISIIPVLMIVWLLTRNKTQRVTRMSQKTSA